MTLKVNELSSDEWELIIGDQFRALRIRADLEQTELAALASISVGALKNLEGGKGSSLKTMVKVARVLGQTDWLNALAPKVSVSPMQLLKGQRKDVVRQKIYRSRKPKMEQ
ncbi:MAG: helix-turn-helix domain-containing protein [Chlorobium sp.]